MYGEFKNLLFKKSDLFFPVPVFHDTVRATGSQKINEKTATHRSRFPASFRLYPCRPSTGDGLSVISSLGKVENDGREPSRHRRWRSRLVVVSLFTLLLTSLNGCCCFCFFQSTAAVLKTLMTTLVSSITL